MRLEVEDLAAGYIQGSRVLDGLSLSIDHGEAVALLGRNGMGKSTLLRTIRRPSEAGQRLHPAGQQ